jgi:NADH-quinone oxidoreductase subunit J
VSLTFIFFIILSVLAITSALVTITSKNPVASALSLVFHFFMLAGLYLTLQAQFVAVIQILVYAGAIMVLVIFVIMLLNLGEEEMVKQQLSLRKGVGSLLGLALAVQLSSVFILSFGSKLRLSNQSMTQSTIQSIGKDLYTYYLYPIEAVGLLLLAAIVGAVILAKRKIV